MTGLAYLLRVAAVQTTIRSRLIFLVWKPCPRTGSLFTNCHIARFFVNLWDHWTTPENSKTSETEKRQRKTLFCSISMTAPFHIRIVKCVDFAIFSHGWRWWTYRITKCSRTRLSLLCFKVWSKYLFCVNSKHLRECVTTKVTSSDFHVRAPIENSHTRKQGCELANKV
jgi:hypothetical protein